jgi:putative DNA methylase
MNADDHPVISPKKLIEVALPLDAINKASAKEKSIRHGHPSTLHLWWARRPLAAARAVIFSQLVNDPEDLWWHQNPGAVPNKQIRGHWTKARQRLFKIIEDLVIWENTTNEAVLESAREEIRKSWREVCDLNKSHPQAAELFNPDKMPGLHDPFAGGGAIPLEAQRLGLEAYASDLNPVAVLINKAMIEIPPKFAGRPPVHPDAREDRKLFSREWRGAEGLAEDVSRYGLWMRDEAEKRIGHLYPKVEITSEMARERPDLKPLVGQQLTVIAWIWARTVKSPNPAFSHVDVPLASTFVLSSKKGKEAFLEPVVSKNGYSLVVRAGTPPSGACDGTKTARNSFACLMSGTPISGDYVKEQGKEGRLGCVMTAVVAEGKKGRIYLSPPANHLKAANVPSPRWSPHVPISGTTQYLGSKPYGMEHFDSLFINRQAAALTELCDLVAQVHSQVQRHVTGDASVGSDTEAKEYAAAIAIYLAFAIDRLVMTGNSLVRWNCVGEKAQHCFGRHALPMLWDFAEPNFMGSATGSLEAALFYTHDSLSHLPSRGRGHVLQADAATQSISKGLFASTDPPYYDNVPYADLSDMFYVWLRRSLKEACPAILSTIAVPKGEELVAFAYRHGSKEDAEAFFLEGMKKAMRQLAYGTSRAAPLTIYYAFKQSDTEADSTVSTGWETFLAAVVSAGLAISGTWPIRTEMPTRQRSQNANALASSIVLVCRPRGPQAGTVSRRQFVRILNDSLPDALAKITGSGDAGYSPVAPVDLSQAIIGPGMAIFSRYDAVLEADGTPMTVKTALQLINRFLAEDDFDGDTQFCLHWFDQHGWEKAKFGEADTLARAKGTSVDGVKAAGVIESGGGNVRLLKWKEYPTDWNASLDNRVPVWEVLHQLIRAYSSKGDAGAGKVLKACAGKAEAARQLAYRLYTLCERKGWAEDARAYNEVVTGWSGIEKSAGTGGEEQRELFDG